MSSELLSKITQLEAIIEARNQQLDQLDRDCRNLQERLNDALNAVKGQQAMAPVATKEPRKIVAPKSGVTKQVWDIADKITYEKRAQGGHPATKAEVVAASVTAGVKEGTAGVAYANWCHFFGVNPKDTSKPYVAKAQMSADADPDAQETPELPMAEHTPIEIPTDPTRTAVRAVLDAYFPPTAPVFAPPPPPPAYLPPAPLPPYNP